MPLRYARRRRVVKSCNVMYSRLNSNLKICHSSIMSDKSINSQVFKLRLLCRRSLHELIMKMCPTIRTWKRLRWYDARWREGRGGRHLQRFVCDKCTTPRIGDGRNGAAMPLPHTPWNDKQRRPLALRRNTASALELYNVAWRSPKWMNKKWPYEVC